MGAYELTITHLCVGLGLSVLIKLKYNDGRNTFLGLLDCGSIVGGKNFYGPALDRIVDEVKGNGHVLNYVHISHFDEDHYNMLKVLGRKYKKDKDRPIEIEKMVFGCAGDKNTAKLKRDFENFFTIKDSCIWQGACAHLNTNGGYTLPSISEYQDLCAEVRLDNKLYFRMIPILYHIQLAPQREEGLEHINLSDSGVYINTGSSVLMVTIVRETDTEIEPQASYIFTGDATLETMKIFQALKRIPFNDERKLLQIAHHGARRHVADEEESGNFQTLEGFLGLIKPNFAVVSAKCKNQDGWTHPHLNTIMVYARHVSKSEKIKFITSFEYTDGKIIVRQGRTMSCLFETFKLYQVDDKTLYKQCKSGNYRLYDVEATISSDHPGQMAVQEIMRRR